MNQYLAFYNPTRATFLSDATPEELDIVEKHAVYLNSLLEQGQLILAGRCLDVPPGIAIFEAADEDCAKKIVDNDPAVVAGVFQPELRPYRVAMMRGRSEHERNITAQSSGSARSGPRRDQTAAEPVQGTIADIDAEKRTRKR